MSDDLTESLFETDRNNSGLISGETRAWMSQMLEPQDFQETEELESEDLPIFEEGGTVQNFPAPFPGGALPTHLSSVVPALIAVVGRIVQDLESNLIRLLSLNPSRREAIAQHLEKLAGSTPALSQALPRALDTPQNHLRRWIEGPRTANQNAALRTYLEEVAIIALGQALVLKSWADRGIRNWSESDLGRLNWALSIALKPYIPLDREGWQITRPNFYSWYNPGPQIQSEIWSALDSWKITQDDPAFLGTLLAPIRRAQPEGSELTGYDSRFFQSLWQNVHLFGFQTEPDQGLLRRNKVVFSPTLRDATLVRTGPNVLTWIGLESSAFQLMLAELMQISSGPCAPPSWSVGTGLEVHTRDQLALALGSPKPSVINKIAEMEACDAAIVLEEQIIRAQGRNTYSNRFREQVDSLPYFKKLRSPGTSLGDLQACVALNKLRPGGILIWTREEPLGPKDGGEVLSFLLGRSKLLCEWNLSEVEHSLPSTIPLYPKYIYLFQRETHLETRLSHRPVRHMVQGLLRSHIELPLLLEDVFHASPEANSDTPFNSRGQWTVHSHPSPIPQKEWIEKWPDPTCQTVIRTLDQLRAASLPLAGFTTIRPTPEGDPAKDGQWSVHLSLKGFWVSSEFDEEGRKFVCHPLPRAGSEVTKSGLLVLVPDQNWVIPLSYYLMSPLVHRWLDHHMERRGDKWILNEQVVKWIPVPKLLLHTLGVPNALESEPQPLPPEWENLCAEVNYQPRLVLDALNQATKSDISPVIHTAVFIQAATCLDLFKSEQNRLLSLVTPEGKVLWRELLNILPKGECVTVALHPRIRLSGSLPPHLPIDRIEKVKSPMPGVLFATESGLSLHVGSESSMLIQMLWDQLEDLKHPTWNELTSYLRLPRKLELAESTALDVLRVHAEQMAKFKEITDLLNSCQLV